MKNFKELMIVATALSAAVACADAVTEGDATAAVAGWVNVKAALGETFTAKPESVVKYDGKDGKGSFYVVRLEGGGYVVTSGDTGLTPVIAYSKDGTWVDVEAQNPILAMLLRDVAAATTAMEAATAASSRSRLLCASSSASTAVDANKSKWASYISAASQSSGSRLLGGTRMSSVSDTRVGVLLTTTWGQGCDIYNLYTPLNRVCGCVATAGAQIMYYHKWPQTSVKAAKDYSLENGVDGQGDWDLTNGYQASSESDAYTAWDPTPFGTYDWANMSGTTSTANKQAIGKLTRDVGIACYMLYGYQSSASSIAYLRDALVDQFYYANAIYKSNPSTDEWTKGILASLDARLPVCVGIPGHAIVADGYGYSGSTLYVHFNLGWGGNWNAWYNPPDLTDISDSYTSIVSMICNIYPQGAADRTIMSGRVKDSSSSLVGDGTTVKAINTSSGDTVTTVTTNSIYALLLPAGTYRVMTGDGAGAVAITNVTVSSCSSGINNIYGAELTMADLEAPTVTSTWGNTFFVTGYVTLSTATEGAEIRYTTDGSDPTTSSTLYDGSIRLTATTTVKAKAFVDGFPSETLTQTFTMQDYWTTVHPNLADTPANRARYWIDESETTHNGTGTWSNEVSYVSNKASIEGENRFEAYSASASGKKTTIKVKLYTHGASDSLAGADNTEAKAAIRIGDGCFQVFTQENGTRKWVDVTGVTPAANTEYDVKFVLNFTTQTYTVTVKPSGGSETALASSSTTVFPFANASTAVSTLLFDGSMDVASIEGSYSTASGAMIILRQ